jgi:autotransporter translocation and assembly factor TamB
MVDQTRQLAAAYGAAVLSQNVAGQMGVDLIMIKAGSSSDQASSLVIGKYLNTRTMIQYETPLEPNATSLVRLNYNLTRDLHVETSVSQGRNSGIDLKWLRDY